MENKIFIIICLVFALILGINSNIVLAYDIDQAIGLNYTSGTQDVFDFYEDVPWLDLKRLIPVGLSYRLVLNYDNGIRTDIGAGPLTLITGNIDYYDVPLTLTIGYNLKLKGDFNPYVRGGLSYHLIDGDYVEDTKPVGFIGALGVELIKDKSWKIFIEVAYDSTEITMKVDESGYNKTENIKLSGVMFSVNFVF